MLLTSNKQKERNLTKRNNNKLTEKYTCIQSFWLTVNIEQIFFANLISIFVNHKFPFSVISQVHSYKIFQRPSFGNILLISKNNFIYQFENLIQYALNFTPRLWNECYDKYIVNSVGKKKVHCKMEQVIIIQAQIHSDLILILKTTQDCYNLDNFIPWGIIKRIL